jgi:hypothetical protein
MNYFIQVIGGLVEVTATKIQAGNFVIKNKYSVLI